MIEKTGKKNSKALLQWLKMTLQIQENSVNVRPEVCAWTPNSDQKEH